MRKWMTILLCLVLALAGTQALAQETAEMEESSGLTNRMAKLAEWEADKGNYHTWTLEDRIAFAAQYDGHDGITPQDSDLPMEEAVRIARGAVLEQGGISEAELDALVLDVFFQTSYAEDRHREWYVSYFDPQTDEQLHVVWIHAGTGAVEGYAGPSNSLG